MNKILIIVPCFNEEKRLKIEEFINFSNNNSVSFCFVNDGSKDDTGKIIKKIIDKTANNLQINFKKNLGKAEAIRSAVIQVYDKYDFEYIGYWDADCATPLSEIMNLRNEILNKKIILVFGSRIKTIGRIIKRKKIRHFLGRIIATVASIILKLEVYDTQCGAKLFDSKFIKKIFIKKFKTKWLFDIEIFFRTKHYYGDDIFLEFPLEKWTDIKGSKISLIDCIKIPYEIIKIIIYYRLKNWI